MDHPERVTTSGQPPTPGHETACAPAPIDPATGMHKDYWVLSDAERAKGFVRPVRRSYEHAGQRPQHPVRELTAEERARFADVGYVAYEAYPESESPVSGRYWTRAQLASGCGAVTTMSQAIAETYARDPKFYGSTFCVRCKAHFPVGEHGEFVWDGTSDKVGT